MVPPVRWYYILSTWIFLASVAYPFHQISTYPLNLFALVGCLEVILNPHKESWVKNVYILLLHLLPFLWIPYDLSIEVLEYSLLFVCAYLVFVLFLNENIVHIYRTLLNEDHPKYTQFLCDRFGYCPKA